MNIGRKVYYQLSSGNVILSTSEMSGDVVETTIDQDFEFYKELQPYQQNAVGVIKMNYGEQAQNFTTYPYHVDITQNPPVIVWDTNSPIGASLQDVQNAKIAQLTDFNQQASSTFQSSALGSVHTYLADDGAMGKLNGEYTFINSSAYDNSPINWYTVEEGGVIHTVAQFNQVWLDGRNHMADNFAKWDTLVKQVKACTTVDAVNAINW